MTDKIILRGMEFYGYHGVLKEEQVLGQKFIIDLEMCARLEQAGKQDDLSKTINYAEVYEIIKQVVTETRFKLIEALAEEIIKSLRKFTNIDKVQVTIHKPQAPIKGIFEDVAVQIERTM